MIFKLKKKDGADIMLNVLNACFEETNRGLVVHYFGKTFELDEKMIEIEMILTQAARKSQVNDLDKLLAGESSNAGAFA